MIVKKELSQKSSRPQTLGEARDLIAETFKFNKWDKREQRVFCEMLGIVYSEKFDMETARLILADMEKAKMILFEEKDLKGNK